MYGEQERMRQQIWKRQRLYPFWFLAIGLFNLALLAILAYVGYKTLVHFGIL